MADVRGGGDVQIRVFNGTTYDAAASVDGLATAPNDTVLGIQAAGIGPGFDTKANPANLATALNSAITMNVDGADIIMFNIGTSTTGTFTFEASADDTSWQIPFVLRMDTEDDLSGTNITPTTGINYAVVCSGFRQVRIRVVTALGATVVVKTTAHVGFPRFYSRLTGWNGSGWDRTRTVTVGDAYAGTGILGAGNYGYNGTTYDRLRTVGGVADAGSTGLSASGGYAYNGATFDRLRTIEGYNTAAATPSIGALAAYGPDRRYTSVSLATAANSTQTWDLNGADTAVVMCGTTTTGTYIFEVTPDGTNWFSAEVYNGTDELWVSGTNLTPTTLKVFRVMTNGQRTLRVRTVTALGATVAFTANISVGQSIVRAVEVGNSPHMIGQTWLNKVAQYTTTQTGTALWTPASGKRIVVTILQIQAGGTTAGTVQVWYGASGDTTYTRGTDYALFDGEFAPSSTLKPGVIMMPGVFLADAADRVLRVTDSAAINPLTVNAWGYETL